MQLPTTEFLLVEQQDHALHITFNRPKARNAMSIAMLEEIIAVFEAIKDNRAVRAVVLCGSDGHFCAGGDIKDMAKAKEEAAKGNENSVYAMNRAFGRMLAQVNEAPQVVITIIEGAVLGGGFGLACVSDVALAKADAKFGLPETGLGIPPAQIAPFVVTRIGLTQARRLALLGARFNGSKALELGIVHEVFADAAELDEKMATILQQVKRCAPEANVLTKQLILKAADMNLENVLDSAAEAFTRSVLSDEGVEGTMAFVEKRNPNWAE